MGDKIGTGGDGMCALYYLFSFVINKSYTRYTVPSNIKNGLLYDLR